MTGGVDGNTSVSELTNLGPSTPSVVYDVGIPFNAGPSVGNSVAPDSVGNADLAIQLLNSSDGSSVAVVGQVAAGGTAVNWAAGYTSSGPNASMNGVTVDGADNVYVTGGIIRHWDPQPFQDIIVASFDSTGNQLAGIRVYYTQSNGDPAQGIGYNLQINPLSGNVFVAITDSILVPGYGYAGNIDFLVFDPGLNNIVGDEGGDVFGSNDDENRGLVLDPSGFATYQIGFTNSPDFGSLSGTFQPTYGGDPYDGIVIGYVST